MDIGNKQQELQGAITTSSDYTKLMTILRSDRTDATQFITLNTEMPLLPLFRTLLRNDTYYSEIYRVTTSVVGHLRLVVGHFLFYD